MVKPHKNLHQISLWLIELASHQLGSKQAKQPACAVYYIDCFDTTSVSLTENCQRIKTLCSGSLGSGVDEDRSELRYVMWIAELWSLTCWTHLAGLGSPEPMPVSGSAKNWSRNVISGIEALAPSFVWEHAFKIEVFAWLRASVALGTLSWVTLKRWPLKQDCPALVDKSECGQQTYDLRSGKSTR